MHFRSPGARPTQASKFTPGITGTIESATHGSAGGFDLEGSDSEPGTWETFLLGPESDCLRGRLGVAQISPAEPDDSDLRAAGGKL